MNRVKLSPGNYVLWDGDPGGIYFINTLQKDIAHIMNINNLADSYYARYEEIHGIPITIENVEICLRIKMEEEVSDFTLPEEKDYYDKNTGRIRLSQRDWMINRPDREGKVWYCHVDSECMDSIGSADIIYIHELQNFLNLTGFFVN